MKKIILLIITTILSIGAPGCVPPETVLTHESANQLMGGAEQGDFALQLQRAEQHWRRADQPGELEAAIQAWEDAIAIDTPGLDSTTRRARLFEVYIRLSRAYYLLGDTVLWLSIEDPERRDAEISIVLARGRDHAERAMGIYSPSFFDDVQKGTTLGEAAEAHLDSGAVVAMFWWSALVGRWLANQSMFTALGYIEDMRRVGHLAHALDPSAFFHAPAGYLGAYYTAIPASMGGDMERSKGFFDEALRHAPGMLQNHLNYAYLYARAADDRALFEALLKTVLSTPDNILPPLAIENHWQKKKARFLLDRIDEYFPPQ